MVTGPNHGVDMWIATILGIEFMPKPAEHQACTMALVFEMYKFVLFHVEFGGGKFPLPWHLLQTIVLEEFFEGVGRVAKPLLLIPTWPKTGFHEHVHRRTSNISATSKKPDMKQVREQEGRCEPM